MDRRQESSGFIMGLQGDIMGNSMSNQQQNAFAFQISTKLGRLVPSGKLLNHVYFGCVKLYGFGVISHSFFQHFGHLAPRS